MIKSSILYFGLGLGLSTFALTACKTPTKDATPAPEPPPPPPPVDLLSYARVATPDVTWAALQKSFGPVASLLPSTFAGLLGSVANLDADVTSMADGASPAFAALEKTPNGVAWAISFRVRDAVRAGGILTSGSPARYAAPSNEAGLQVYTRTNAAPDTLAATTAIGVTPTRIVFASDRAALVGLGPYAARTLPAQAFAEGAIVLQADHPSLAGPLHDLLASRWAAASAELHSRAQDEERAHGRPADFGNPEALQTMFDGWMQTDLAVVADLDRASIALDVDDGDLVAHAKLTPTASGTMAAPTITQLSSCDLAPIGQASLDSPLALLVCHKPGDANATDGGSAIEAAVGPHLSLTDTATLRTALSDASKAFGTWTRLSLASDMTGVRLDMPTSDPTAAMTATRELVNLAQIPAFREPLAAEAHLKLAAVSDGSARFDTVAAAKSTKEGMDKRSSAPAQPITASWNANAGNLAFALGASSTKLLAPPITVLANDVNASQALGRLGPSATFALALQPAVVLALFAHATATPPATHDLFVLGWGKTGNDAWITASIDAPLVRELSRMMIGL